MAKTTVQKSTKPSTNSKPKASTASPSFIAYLTDRAQWIDWGIIAGLYVAILIFLKLYYPYPQTETDSGNYIVSAVTGKINGYRPYGYSGFLSFFHAFSTDIRFVVTWQWLVTFLSVAYFLFTVKFIFRAIPRIAFWLLAVCTIINPSIIFMNSYLMSDGLFINLTLLFLTSCMWLLHSGSYLAMAANLALLWWAMDTRYIGLFYPFFSALCIGWALYQRLRWVAIAGMIVPVAMLLVYQSSMIEKMKEEFGVETFSAFGGWQKANNAVAILPYEKVNEAEMTDPQMKSIHQIVRSFPDSCFSTQSIIATNFMWTKNYPGKACLIQYIQQTGTPYAKAWAYMGTQMQAYGSFLESHYQGAYLKYYVFENLKNVFKAWTIEEYQDFKADDNMKTFFTTDRDSYHYKNAIFRPLTTIRQLCDTAIWILFAISIIAGSITLCRIAWSLSQKLIILMLILFVLAFVAASAYAAPVNNFRYIMPIFYAQLLVPFLIGIVIWDNRKSASNEVVDK
jgi:hypothetical protein